MILRAGYCVIKFNVFVIFCAPSSKVIARNLEQYTYYIHIYTYCFILSLIGCSRGTLQPLCNGFVSFVITNGFVKGAPRCISENNHENMANNDCSYDIGERINRYGSKKKKIRVIFQWLLKPHKWHTYNILYLHK